MPTSNRLSTLSRSLVGRSVIVTGAASGMGRATAHLFADEGAHVTLADLGADRIAEVVAEIDDAHGTGVAAGLHADVADPDQLAALVELAVESFGRIDAAVNNAGVALPTAAPTSTSRTGRRPSTSI